MLISTFRRKVLSPVSGRRECFQLDAAVIMEDKVDGLCGHVLCFPAI
jgi:hypothetical protein